MQFLNRKRSFLKSFLLLFGLLFATNAYAANLYFSPATGNYSTGNIFKVSALVDTENQAINSTETSITFPSDLLEVVSVSKTNSIFSFWVQGPSFSNTSGQINFSGGLPTPGYVGTKGNLIDIVFKAKKSGQASLLFVPGSVRANDGMGTNVLNNIAQAIFTLGASGQQAPEEVPQTSPKEGTGGAVPSAPEISSPTNSNPEGWYNNPNPQFTWKLSSGITAVRLLYDKFPDTNPTVLYSPAIPDKTLSGLADGTYYFHVQFKNVNGWGAVSHFKFQIDTKNPDSFTIGEIKRDDETIPQAKFTFTATDSLSGIDHYGIQIDGGAEIAWSDDGSHIYQTAALGGGQHSLSAKAYDKAGNFITATASFNVTAIQAPNITEYDETILTSESLKGEGQTYPSSKVIIHLQKDGGEVQSFEATSDQNGHFIFPDISDLPSGTYSLWSEVLDSHGARSLSSEKLTVVVNPTSLIQSTARLVGLVGFLGQIVILILLLLLGWYGWYKFLHLRRIINKGTYNAEVGLRKAFGLLDEDLKKQIDELNRASSERDLAIIKNIKKSLSDAEDMIEGEIKDIEKKTNIHSRNITSTTGPTFNPPLNNVFQTKITNAIDQQKANDQMRDKLNLKV